MCEYYGLPLALIFEELVDMDKPEDKAQEQRPAGTEQEQQSKGTANNQPPPLCLRQIFSRRPCALYRPLRRFHASCGIGYSRQLKRPLAASMGLVWPCACVPLHHGIIRRLRYLRRLSAASGAGRLCYTSAARGYYFLHSRSIGKAPPRKKRASEGVFFTRSIQGLFRLCFYSCLCRRQLLLWCQFLFSFR